MRSKRVVAVLLLVFLVVLPVALLMSTQVQIQSLTINQSRSYTVSQTVGTPINITSSSDFVTLGATGVGTRADPYVLSNLVISTVDGPCISVTGTTAYFILYNCILESDSVDPVIVFDTVENGQVIFCEIVGGASGVEFLNTLDCSVSNSTIYGCWIGIYMDMAINCTATLSRISNNHRGLQFERSSFIEIANNSIYSNSENGLEFSPLAYNNTVIGNSFGWNAAYPGPEENAVDHGVNNTFDDGIIIGNAWSDFNGTIPYSILSTNGTSDSYPLLLEDNVIPLLLDEYDTAIDVETSGNRLIWTARDEFPQRYTIDRDGAQIYAAFWNGDDIIVDLDPVPVGSYIYVLRVFDGAGNSASDQVFVSVVSFVLGGIGTELVMIASGFTVVIFLTIVLIIKRLS
ncbi:MAG: right-handed parallel beta-helix repeat-containing protein [Candidatus Thorarchaeota archaeon]